MTGDFIELTPLFALQEALDQEIALAHDVTYETTFPRRLMALLVELGEFANETRCFKYWSVKGPSPKEVILDEYADKLEEEGRIRVSGKKGIDSRTGVVSIQTLSLDQAEASVLLEEQYGILTRVGLHCAPSAHKTLGTYPTGTIRFSFGFYNTQADVDAALSALEELSRGRA